MVSKIKDIIKNKAVLFTLLSAVASGINFLSLIAFGRVFQVEDYAVVTTFQAFVSNVAVFMTPLQIMICKDISDKKENGTEIGGYIGMALGISAIECALFLVGAIPCMKYLHFVSAIEYVLFVVLILANNIYTLVIGMAQGRQSFILLGIASLLLYGVKMIIGVLLGLMGMGPVAVIIGFAVAEIICIAAICYRLAGFISLKDISRFNIKWSAFDNYFWVLCLYTIVSLYMNSGDLLLANLYCPQKEIGLYSVAINLAKISVFLIATPVATILLPKVVVCKGDTGRQRKILLLAEGVTFGISAVYGMMFFAVSKWIIPLLYGEEYRGASFYVLSCVIFSVVLGMFWVFYQYAVATDIMKPFTVVTAVCGVVLIAVALFFRIDLNIIPIAMVGAMAISVLGILLYVRYVRGVVDAV